ncbi:hypothetical protein T484DRAFT_1949621, partial [Baffinella frigidus]
MIQFCVGWVGWIQLCVRWVCWIQLCVIWVGWIQFCVRWVGKSRSPKRVKHPSSFTREKVGSFGFMVM